VFAHAGRATRLALLRFLVIVIHIIIYIILMLQLLNKYYEKWITEERTLDLNAAGRTDTARTCCDVTVTNGVEITLNCLATVCNVQYRTSQLSTIHLWIYDKHSTIINKCCNYLADTVVAICRLIFACRLFALVELSPLFVFFDFPDVISKTDASRITTRDIQMFHDESWKPIYFGV